MSEKKAPKAVLIFILGLLSSIGPISIDLYLPAFSAIASDLKTDVSSVMLSLSAFFVGISLGQLVYGPLLERFGRKKPLYGGLALYALASVGCALSESVEALIFFRGLQALGGCVGMVASRTLVRDLFPVHQIAKVFSSLMLVIAVSPLIAPTLGSLITIHLGWRALFGVLVAVITAIVLGIYFLLPEGAAPNPSYSLKPKSILKSFKSVLAEPQFALYTATSSIAYSGLYAYISGSPFVFMDYFMTDETTYGLIFALIAAGLIGTAQINGFLLTKWGSDQIIRIALSIQSLVGLTLVLLTATGLIQLWSMVGLLFLFLSCQGLIFPNASALSMAPFSKNAGNASALMGFFQMSVGALLSALVSLFHDGTALPMTGVMAFCTLGASTVLAFGRLRLVRRASKALLAEEEAEMINTL